MSDRDTCDFIELAKLATTAEWVSAQALIAIAEELRKLNQTHKPKPYVFNVQSVNEVRREILGLEDE